MTLRNRNILISAVLILLAGLVLIYFLAWRSSGFNADKYGTVDYDLTYCRVGDQSLLMDVYYPDSGGPWPALIFVHGGGWTEGDKSGVDSSPVAFGYLVVSINYRLYPEERFPAMIEDVKCAIRSLRAHAGRYNLDPERMALIGHSAGGHLVALAGLADKSAGWDVGPYWAASSRVQAVIVLAGPADLTREFPSWVTDLIQGVFGPQQVVSGSPVIYASPDDPPVLIIQGDADPVVPLEQAVILRDALTAAGARAELIVVQNGGHGFEPLAGPASPNGDELFRLSLEFLERALDERP